MRASTSDVVERALRRGKLTKYDETGETSVSQRILVREDGRVTKVEKKVDYVLHVPVDGRIAKIDFWRRNIFGETDTRNLVSERDVRLYYNKKRAAVEFDPVGETLHLTIAKSKNIARFKVLEHTCPDPKNRTSGIIVGWFV